MLSFLKKIKIKRHCGGGTCSEEMNVRQQSWIKSSLVQNITFWFLFRFRNYQRKSRWGELIGVLSFRIAEKPSLIKMVVLVCGKINLKIAVKKKGAIISSPFIITKHSFCLSLQRSAVGKKNAVKEQKFQHRAQKSFPPRFLPIRQTVPSPKIPPPQILRKRKMQPTIETPQFIACPSSALFKSRDIFILRLKSMTNDVPMDFSDKMNERGYPESSKKIKE